MEKQKKNLRERNPTVKKMEKQKKKTLFFVIMKTQPL